MVTIKRTHTQRHKHRLHTHILLSRHDLHKSMVAIKRYTSRCDPYKIYFDLHKSMVAIKRNTRQFSVDMIRKKVWSPQREHTHIHTHTHTHTHTDYIHITQTHAHFSVDMISTKAWSP